MPISVIKDDTVAFTSTSSSDVTAWLWEFGDGATSTSQNPTHVYTAKGTYTVVLYVTGTRGTVRTSDVVTVTDSTRTAYSAPTTGSTLSPGVDPVVMLRLSNDAGKTWICEMMRRAGKSGEYWKRVRWNRLGMARRRVFEVTVCDPLPWRLTGAYLESTVAGQTNG